MNPSVDIPLHDIMPLVDVSDTSMYWFIALAMIAVIVLASGITWMLKWKRNNKTDVRSHHYEALQNIDVKNPKQSAYMISKEGYIFAYDNERTLKVYQNLLARLERYKYAKTVEKIDEETLKQYREYLEIIEV